MKKITKPSKWKKKEKPTNKKNKSVVLEFAKHILAEVLLVSNYKDW